MICAKLLSDSIIRFRKKPQIVPKISMMSSQTICYMHPGSLSGCGRWCQCNIFHPAGLMTPCGYIIPSRQMGPGQSICIQYKGTGSKKAWNSYGIGLQGLFPVHWQHIGNTGGSGDWQIQSTVFYYTVWYCPFYQIPPQHKHPISHFKGKIWVTFLS